jgi:luciferase-type oxidoreductase
MSFQTINKAYNETFKPGRLSLGIFVPIENYSYNAVPTMQHDLQRVQLAEELGFSAIWLRDVPFNVPTFGDAGQLFDPFVYLGYLAGNTSRIALGVSSIVLPLRHPAHVAKSAASADVLSGGRILLGVASGDRPEEYPAFNLPFENRGESFRSSMDYIRDSWDNKSGFTNAFGSPGRGIDLLPKPTSGKLPLLITGSSRQSPDWLARNGDGWMTYPRRIDVQTAIITDWRKRMHDAGVVDKPAMQSLYIDLQDDPDATLRPIHLGFSSGVNALRSYLKELQHIGINHVALNLRFNKADIESTLKRLAKEILPDFN